MNKRNQLNDASDRALFVAYKRGELVPVPNQKKVKAVLKKAAENYYKKKEARINIRITTGVLEGLKARAEEEGLPYQTFIASILHKFVHGRLGKHA
jgi:hypothetical protein